MGTVVPPTRVGELPEISLDAVKSLVAGSLSEMTPELEARMAELVEQGNQLLGRYETTGHPAEQIDERTARENLRRLVQAMVDDAAARSTTTLDVEALNRALSRLCPLPPWCR
jgi:hypothetical protein